MIRLKPNPKAAKAHYEAIKDRIRQRALNILNGRIGTTGNRPVVTNQMNIFLQSMQHDINIEALVTAPASELPGIIGRFRNDYLDPNNVNDDLWILKNLFVNSLYDDLDHFSKLDFVKTINLDTCAYCNRNYIYYLSGMEAAPIKPQIDHFYPKAQYPYLAISFYNLIPSCACCNSNEAKGESDPITLGLENPYLFTEDSSFKFSYDPVNIDVLRPLANKFGIKVFLKNKIESHNRVFKLEKLYEQHGDHVQELIVKSKGRYAEAYRRYLKSYSGMEFDDFEIERLILGNYASPDEVHKRPLAKLYQDIGRELGLIKKIPE